MIDFHFLRLARFAGIACSLVWVFFSPGCKQASLPGPPQVNPDGADKEVAQLLQAMSLAVEQAPADAERRAELGLAYEINGLPAAALTCFQQASSLQPNSARLQYFIAVSQGNLGELESAVETIRSVLQKEDRYVPAHLYLGRWLLDLGRYEEAENWYQRALALAPKSRPASIGLARVALKLDRSDEAIAILTNLAEDSAQRHDFVGRGSRLSARTHQSDLRSD